MLKFLFLWETSSVNITLVADSIGGVTKVKCDFNDSKVAKISMYDHFI